MGLLRVVFKVVGVLVLALIGLTAFLYFTDYEADATITQKGRDEGGDYVVIHPRLIPTDLKQHVDAQAAQFVCVGYKVTFRVQSQHYRVLDQRDRLVYDSESGLNDAFSPARCSGLPL